MLFLLLLVWSILGDLRAERGARGIPVGIFRIKPKLTADVSFTDNLLSSKDKVADTVITLKPVLQAVTHWRKYTVDLTFKSEVGRHGTREMEDYIDHSTKLKVAVAPTKNLSLEAQASYSSKHSSRGAADNLGAATSEPPEQYNLYKVSGKAQYTKQRYRGVVELGHNVDAKTGTGRYWNDLSVSLMYALSPKTSFYLQGVAERHVYDDATLLRDNMEYGGAVGVEWEATAKTTGNVKAGWTQKTYADAADKDVAGFATEADIKWSPSSRTRFTLSAGRSLEEGGNTDDYYTATKTQLEVQHSLRSFLSLNAQLGYDNNVYGNGRDDVTWTGSAGFDYQFPKWASLGGRYSYSDIASNAADSSYDSNVFMLTLEGGL
uniref:Outer membrane beta-barrel protein n=1 Tax=Magnetococcus massalia (strain MO-1) TaxID=451514 RepID=A0A1S7LKR0_MAGMO|nr:conserved outer membrane protein of unknown function [Candidatus Magnetococcus massalia]